MEETEREEKTGRVEFERVAWTADVGLGTVIKSGLFCLRKIIPDQWGLLQSPPVHKGTIYRI